jgi:cyclopropane fatty-acyl-phospholipid synthase-like methyltransferase
MVEDTRSEWVEFFNGHAPEYETNCFTKNTQAEVDFLFEELDLAPGMTLLDLGCGTGRHTVELARRGLQVTGIDVSPGMLAEARQNAEKAGVKPKFIEADAREFSLDPPVDRLVCLCEGAFGLLDTSEDPIAQPEAILANAAAAMKPGAKCLFTVLNGYAIARRYKQSDVENGQFDPLALAEVSECQPTGGDTTFCLRERGFVPTELTLLFRNAGIEVLHIWGGTAGNWGRRPIDLDEIEIMFVGRKRE